MHCIDLRHCTKTKKTISSGGIIKSPGFTISFASSALLEQFKSLSLLPNNWALCFFSTTYSSYRRRFSQIRSGSGLQSLKMNEIFLYIEWMNDEWFFKVQIATAVVVVLHIFISIEKLTTCSIPKEAKFLKWSTCMMSCKKRKKN